MDRAQIPPCTLNACNNAGTLQMPQTNRYGASNDYLLALSTAAALMLVIARPAGGAGVLDRVGGADRL